MKRDLFFGGGKLSTFKKDDGAQRIEGYACLWDVYSAPVWDEFYWIFDPHMLDGVLDLPELDCKMNLGHDNRDILARWYPEKGVKTLDLAIDSIGLKFGFNVPNTTLGRDTVENVANGNLVGCSMAVMIEEYEIAGKYQGLTVRRVKSCSWLGDVCLTPDPAFPATSTWIEKYSKNYRSKEDYLSMAKTEAPDSMPDEYFKRTFEFLNLDRK